MKSSLFKGQRVWIVRPPIFQLNGTTLFPARVEGPYILQGVSNKNSYYLGKPGHSDTSMMWDREGTFGSTEEAKRYLVLKNLRGWGKTDYS